MIFFDKLFLSRLLMFCPTKRPEHVVPIPRGCSDHEKTFPHIVPIDVAIVPMKRGNGYGILLGENDIHTLSGHGRPSPHTTPHPACSPHVP